VTTIDKIWQYIDANEPFTVQSSNGRKFLVKDLHWIGAYPSRKRSSVTIHGLSGEEEHFVPLFAVTSTARNENSQSEEVPK
jgi:hypothetical protein